MNIETRKMLMTKSINVKNMNLPVEYFLKESCPSCKYYCECPKYCWVDGEPRNWEPNERVLEKILELGDEEEYYKSKKKRSIEPLPPVDLAGIQRVGG